MACIDNAWGNAAIITLLEAKDNEWIYGITAYVQVKSHVRGLAFNEKREQRILYSHMQPRTH